MKPLKFLFGIHNHQPVGNFGHVFEENFNKCYRPYFDILQKFPKLKTTAHFSGPLLEWIQSNHPDFIKRLRDLAGEGRLEILSGGFYEPLLSILPEEDAIGQIEMMNAFIQEEFGVKPEGLWLAERIWTPSLPRILAKADIRYTLIDDTHFFYSGLEASDLNGFYITEQLGHPLYVFPISKELRYSIPFKQPEDILAWCRYAKDELGFDGVTYGDDGEKFGGWPDTYQWVYNEHWLERFFSAMNDAGDWIQMDTFSSFIDSHTATGRVYLPMASYDEMMEWSLNTSTGLKFQELKSELEEKGIAPERYKVFLRGGQWNNFLTKYEESNNLHKKMLYVSKKIKTLQQDSQKTRSALRELYRGQCNCAQWHGMFGGLYLNYLRHALYNHLIAAENLVDDAVYENSRPLTVEQTDFNLDGHDEVIVSNQAINAYFAPAYGGSLFELDYRPLCFNLNNVLRRREETYHQTIRHAQSHDPEGEGEPQSIHDRVHFKEDGLADRLFYDPYERYSFMDHFLSSETTFELFEQGRYEESGKFSGAPYSLQPLSPPQADKEYLVNLVRKDSVKNKENTFVPIQLQKTFAFSTDQAEFRVDYQITNCGQKALDLWFGVENNFTLLAGDAPDRNVFIPGLNLEDSRLGSRGEHFNVEQIGLRDDWFGFQLTLSFSRPATVWRFPVESVSQSEDGFERTYQGSCLLSHWRLYLEVEEISRLSISLKVSPGDK